jgi:hypothetical protein
MPKLLFPEPQSKESVAKTVGKLWEKLGVTSKQIIEANSLQTKLTFDPMGRLTKQVLHHTRVHPELNDSIDSAQLGQGHLKTNGVRRKIRPSFQM